MPPTGGASSRRNRSSSACQTSFQGVLSKEFLAQEQRSHLFKLEHIALHCHSRRGCQELDLWTFALVKPSLLSPKTLQESSALLVILSSSRRQEALWIPLISEDSTASFKAVTHHGSSLRAVQRFFLWCLRQRRLPGFLLYCLSCR